MEILIYDKLDLRNLSKQFNKVVEMIKADDFRSAEVKKITSAYYRAKLDYENRLLFKIVRFEKRHYALLLEIIHGHNYDRSKFLNGKKIDESTLKDFSHVNQISDQDYDRFSFINTSHHSFHVLNKIISFDNEQESIFKVRPPVIIIGSAGSGKTALTLEKIKELRGDVLYVTHSPYLVDNSRNIYYSFSFENEEQNVDFLSFKEYVETIRVPAGKEVDFKVFRQWFAKYSYSAKITDSHKIFEEFNGVLTGSTIDTPFLTREEYLCLGVRQSIFTQSDRNIIYDYFEKYLEFLKREGFYDLNILAFEYIRLCTKRYDFVVVDEVQDLTNIQLYLILSGLRCRTNFMLCGDSNQIVHPNFFSWASIKTLFYNEYRVDEESVKGSSELIRILYNNYRNSPEITDLANKLILTKNARFGSVDKETNYLVRCISTSSGAIEFFTDDQKIKSELNNKTKKSTKFAVLVMREEDKQEAKESFQTPLIFSIQEAKGLEYDNIILYNFISKNHKEFQEISRDVSKSDLEKELTYGRAKDKEDKSLEAYKFYINSLYVAVTRAMKNIYIIEKNSTHPLMLLLGIGKTKEKLDIKAQDSSLEEWKREAQKLELQGKKEQSEKIRKEILGTKDVPWDIITPDYFYKLKDEAFNEEHYNRQAKLRIFEYALMYNVPYIFSELVRFKFNKASNPEKEKSGLLHKYVADYAKGNHKELLKKVDLYGVDFRNPLNQTSLMLAAKYGNDGLVDVLLENGAKKELTDNWGLTPLQISLRESYLSEEFAKKIIGVIYKKLAPDHIKVKVEDKMVKIDNTLMEFFLLNSMIAMFQEIVRVKIKHRIPAFETGDFIHALNHFPEFVIPERRKKRAYISSVLAKNEIYGNSSGNRKIFVRVSRGFYVINPRIEILIGESWVNVCDLLNIQFLEKETHDKALQNLLKVLKDLRGNLPHKPEPERKPDPKTE